MPSMNDFYAHLRLIFKVLLEEKNALLNNEGFKIEEIVKTKNLYIEKLSMFKGMDIEKDEKAMSFLKEINSLQEVNLLLTKQALSYQNVLLESISKNIHSMSNTYSAKGNYESANSIGLIDHSV